MKRPWLAPFTPLYAAGIALRNRRIESGREPVKRLRWPVISVGSLSAGGAGKTPTTIALAKALTSAGFAVDVLSRGYKRRSTAAAQVRMDGIAEEFGDEPLLIARATSVPVYVAAQRYEAGLLAEAPGERDGAAQRVHLLDDGFQHRQLARDVDLLLVSQADWHDALLPAGDLREPRRAALRASAILTPAEEPELERELRAWGWTGPVWRIQREIKVPAREERVIAFCGIARPDQFFAGLEREGLRVAGRIAFADHHRYTPPDLESIAKAARAKGTRALVTTEKDEARLGPMVETLRRQLPVLTVELRVVMEDEAIRWLVERVVNLTAAR